MSAEDLANKLHRNPELSNSEVAFLLTAMQGLRDVVVEDFSTNLIVQADETRTRKITQRVGQDEVSSKTRTRHLTRTGTVMLRSIPSPQNFYPLIHTEVGGGALTFPGADTMFGGRIVYDGTNYITVDDDPRLNPTLEIGMSMWIYLANLAGTQSIVEKASQYQLRMENGQLEWNVFDGGGIQTVLTRSISAGVWTHIGATYDTTNGKSLWTGATISTDSESGDIATTANLLGIGATGAGSNVFPNNTRLAQLSMLNGELTTSWITDHMAGLLNTDTSNTPAGFDEILTIPFNGDALPRPDATFGIAKT